MLVRILLGDARGDGFHVALRPLEGDPGRDTGDRLEELSVPRSLPGLVVEGRPQLASAGEIEARRHDADDRVRLLVEHQRRAEHRGAGAEAALPETVTEDGETRSADAVFVGREQPSSDRLDAERGEGARGHAGAADSLGVISTGHGVGGLLVDAEVVEHGIELEPVPVHGKGDRKAVPPRSQAGVG